MFPHLPAPQGRLVCPTKNLGLISRFTSAFPLGPFIPMPFFLGLLICASISHLQNRSNKSTYIMDCSKIRKTNISNVIEQSSA